MLWFLNDLNSPMLPFLQPLYNTIMLNISSGYTLASGDRGRYRIFQKEGCGLLRVWIFHTWIFCSGTYHVVHGQNTGGQNPGGQNTIQNCKEGQNACHFWPNMYLTDSQVN